MGSRKHFTTEFKREAVQLLENESKGVRPSRRLDQLKRGSGLAIIHWLNLTHSAADLSWHSACQREVGGSGLAIMHWNRSVGLVPGIRASRSLLSGSCVQYKDKGVRLR